MTSREVSPTSLAVSPLAVRAVLRSDTSWSTLDLIVVDADSTQGIGLEALAHVVTSLPPMETVMSPIRPGLAAMKARAAPSWVAVGYVTAWLTSCDLLHPMALMSDVGVAPPHPKFS